jgi:cation diffusion facilitator family transporter
MAAENSAKVVLVALVCSGLSASAKFAGAVLTGSSALLSEAVHSLVAASSQALRLYGVRHATRPADARSPFGHSSDLYFWTFIVALLLFSMGAGVAINAGVKMFADAVPIRHAHLGYAALAASLVLTSFAMWRAGAALGALGREAPPALRGAKDPALFCVGLESTASIIGSLIALAGLVASDLGGIAGPDAAASILVGLVLAVVAALIALELKAVLAGEAVDPALRESVRAMVAAEIRSDRHVIAIDEIRVLPLAPRNVLVTALAAMDEAARAHDVAAARLRLADAIVARFPEVSQFDLQPQSARDRGTASPAASASDTGHHASQRAVPMATPPGAHHKGGKGKRRRR